MEKAVRRHVVSQGKSNQRNKNVLERVQKQEQGGERKREVEEKKAMRKAEKDKRRPEGEQGKRKERTKKWR